LEAELADDRCRVNVTVEDNQPNLHHSEKFECFANVDHVREDAVVIGNQNHVAGLGCCQHQTAEVPLAELGSAGDGFVNSITVEPAPYSLSVLRLETLERAEGVGDARFLLLGTENLCIARSPAVPAKSANHDITPEGEP